MSPTIIREPHHRRKDFNTLTNVEAWRLTHVLGAFSHASVVVGGCHACVDPVDLEGCGRRSTVQVDP